MLKYHFSSRSIFENREGLPYHEIVFLQPDLTLPSHEMYVDLATRGHLRKFIKKIVSLVDPKSPAVEQEIEDLVNFEVTLSLLCKRLHLAESTRLRLGEADAWAAVTPTWGPWTDFVNDLLRTIKGNETQLVTPDHLAVFQGSWTCTMAWPFKSLKIGSGTKLFKIVQNC